MADLSVLPETHINDQIILNHKGEVKDTLKNLKGVLLKTILEQIEFVYDKPRTLNEFYFVFVATDNYKVVFSWNEIFNTETGNNFYLITSIEGKTHSEIKDRIIFISTKDFKKGRRYIKGLEKIIVKQID